MTLRPGIYYAVEECHMFSGFAVDIFARYKKQKLVYALSFSSFFLLVGCLRAIIHTIYADSAHKH
jgi:hypothetical protein